MNDGNTDSDRGGADLAAFSDHFSAKSDEADINHDQRIDKDDVQIFEASQFGTSL